MLLSSQLRDGKIQEKTKRQPPAEAGGPKKTPALHGPTKSSSHPASCLWQQSLIPGEVALLKAYLLLKKAPLDKNTAYLKSSRMNFSLLWMLESPLSAHSHARQDESRIRE